MENAMNSNKAGKDEAPQPRSPEDGAPSSLAVEGVNVPTPPENVDGEGI